MKLSLHNWSLYRVAAFAASVAGYGWIAYQFERTAFTELIGIAFILFMAFLLLIKVQTDIFSWLWIAIFFRLIFLASEPTLSDDYYRFIWDGKLWHQNESAYSSIPEHVGDSVKLEIDSDGELLKNMNSSAYFSVYPPLHQAVFWLAAFGKNTFQSIVILRLIVIAFDIALILMLIAILRKMQLPVKHAAIYALNPLVIIESTGNLHLEVIMMFFFVSGIWLLMLQKIRVSAAAMVASLLLKMTSAIYLPILFLKLKVRERIWWAGTIAVLVLITSYVLISVDEVMRISQSLDLYFRRFEFNASIYYVTREIGTWITGYNAIHFIGPILSVLSACIILFFSFSNRLHDWQGVFIALCKIGLVYLLFSTTVHPWYVIPLVVLMIPAGVIFPLVWSFLIILSYSVYSSTEYNENFYIIALEYFLLFTAVFLEFKWPERVRGFIFSTAGESQ
jgi:alpha-1,6-mannosyltransferase